MSRERLTEPYLELRRQTMARDRSLREKVMTLEEAAELVEDGDTVGIGGSTLSRTPMAMIWALIRAAQEEPVVSRAASPPARATCCSRPAPATTS